MRQSKLKKNFPIIILVLLLFIVSIVAIALGGFNIKAIGVSIFFNFVFIWITKKHFSVISIIFISVISFVLIYFSFFKIIYTQNQDILNPRFGVFTKFCLSNNDCTVKRVGCSKESCSTYDCIGLDNFEEFNCKDNSCIVNKSYKCICQFNVCEKQIK